MSKKTIIIILVVALGLAGLIIHYQNQSPKSDYMDPCTGVNDPEHACLSPAQTSQ